MRVKKGLEKGLFGERKAMECKRTKLQEDSNLSHDKCDDGYSRAQKGGQHKSFESVNDAFVLESTRGRHSGERFALVADVHKNLMAEN